MVHSWGGAALNPVPQSKVLAVNVFNELLRRHIPLEQSHDGQGLRRAANARDAGCAQVEVTLEDDAFALIVKGLSSSPNHPIMSKYTCITANS